MKWLCPAWIGIGLALALPGRAAGQATNVAQNRFYYELYTAESGDLYESSQKNAYVNDLVKAVFVDSKGRVFVGTANGLAVYDGNDWTNRTFRIRDDMSSSGRRILGLLGVSESAPENIAEGPAGTIWLGGSGCGVWRFRNGRYDVIGSTPDGRYLGMAVENSGLLWVVTRDNVQTYDGKAWTVALSPYITHTVHRELPQLHGIVIDTNGTVWIGGTVYGDPQAPWQHDGAVWVVDQEKKKRANGPPMAALYEFDGKGWRAFGPPHGLAVKSRDTVIPRLDAQGRVIVQTRTGYHRRDGTNWMRLMERDVDAGKRWVLRARGNTLPPKYFAELLFRDGDSLVPVRPTDRRTGEALDLGSEPLGGLRMAEDKNRGCIWLGTRHGLYRIWPENEVVR